MSNEVENTGKILIYQNEKGDTKIDVYFEEDTIWMTQKAMCELYQVAKSSVSEHISNIFKDGELEPEATVRKFRTVEIPLNLYCFIRYFSYIIFLNFFQYFYEILFLLFIYIFFLFYQR